MKNANLFALLYFLIPIKIEILDYYLVAMYDDDIDIYKKVKGAVVLDEN